MQTICKPTGRDRTVLEGTGRDEGVAKSVQEGTERDQKGPDGTKSTELQNRGLQVHLPITSPPHPAVRERDESCRACGPSPSGLALLLSPMLRTRRVPQPSVTSSRSVNRPPARERPETPEKGTTGTAEHRLPRCWQCFRGSRRSLASLSLLVGRRREEWWNNRPNRSPIDVL